MSGPIKSGQGTGTLTPGPTAGQRTGQPAPTAFCRPVRTRPFPDKARASCKVRTGIIGNPVCNRSDFCRQSRSVGRRTSFPVTTGPCFFFRSLNLLSPTSPLHNTTPKPTPPQPFYPRPARAAISAQSHLSPARRAVFSIVLTQGPKPKTLRHRPNRPQNTQTAIGTRVRTAPQSDVPRI